MGVPVVKGGQTLPPMVEIGLTDLPKYGVAMASPAPPGTTYSKVPIIRTGPIISTVLIFLGT